MMSTDRIREHLDNAHRHLATARSRSGRIATAAGATVAVTGVFTGAATSEALLANVIATSVGLALLPTRRAEGQQKSTATVLYCAPGVTLAVLLIVERVVPGAHWGEALAAAAWSAGVWILRPAHAARQMLTAPAPAAEVDVAAVETGPPPGSHAATIFWHERVAIEGGAAPGTVLEDVERTGPESLRAVIRSAAAGQPVPDISIRHLSALMDVPEELIKVGPVPGRGASVRRLTVGTAEQNDPKAMWAQRIAPLAMPGSVITSIHHQVITKETNA